MNLHGWYSLTEWWIFISTLENLFSFSRDTILDEILQIESWAIVHVRVQNISVPLYIIGAKFFHFFSQLLEIESNGNITAVYKFPLNIHIIKIVRK